jgi:hypothetical protein
MAVSVSPNEAAPTHHISLSDGVDTIGLIAVGPNLEPDPLTISRSPVDRNPLKTLSGNSTYNDFNYPYSVIAQDDWSGGRAADLFEKDKTRFYDSYRVLTDRGGRLTLAARDNFARGLRAQEYSNWGGDLYGFGGTTYGAEITVAADMTEQHLYLLVAKLAAGASATVNLYAGTSTAGALVRTSSLGPAAPVSNVLGWVSINLTSGALAAGTYFLAIENVSSGGWRIGVLGGALLPARPIYRLASSLASASAKYFEYKEQTYCAFGNVVYMNGDRGACDSNAGQLNKLIDATKSWLANEWVGCAVKLFPSSGASAGDEQQPWRMVVSNDATSLTVDGNWTIEHTTLQNYVILGSAKWQSVLTLAGNISDVLTTKSLADGIAYFALGSDINVRRYRAYNNAGVWTNENADDGSNRALRLQLVYDATNGWEIWRAQRLSVSKASLAAWGTNLSFGTAINTDSRINGLQAYADGLGAETLWAFTEAGPLYIQSAKAVRIPLREIDTLKSEKNGRASAVQGVYLFFNQGNGLERYYNGNLDDIGPNLDEGMPDGRGGVITSLVSYPGRIFAAVSYETDVALQGKGVPYYSCVLTYNGSGWHEVYRSPVNRTISNIFFQAVPGSTDRLWIALDNDLAYIPLPSETFDPLRDSRFRYAPDGEIITAWINSGFADAYKYFRSIKLHLDKTFSTWFIDGPQSVLVSSSYRLDENLDWVAIAGNMLDVPFDEEVIGARGVNGRRIQFRFRLQTTDARKSPVIKASIIEAVTVTPTKHAYGLSCFLKANPLNLRGEPEATDAETMIAQLDTWSGTAQPLQMRCVHPLYDSVDVFLMPSTLRAVARTNDNGEFGYHVSVLLQEA